MGSRIKNPVVRNGASVEETILSAINASNVRLSRLSLRGCRISGRVDLTDATLDGDLEISDVAPLDNGSPCQIFARVVKGNIDAKKVFNDTETPKPEKPKTHSSKRVDETADAHIGWLTRQYDCPQAKPHEQKPARDRLIACAIKADSAKSAQEESVYGTTTLRATSAHIT